MIDATWIKLGVLGVIFGILMIGSFALKDINKQTHVVEITRDAERECTGSGDTYDCRYIVYTSEGVFENRDSIWHLKFNSSDMHNGFTQGRTCTLTTVGFRNGVMSMYPNTIEATCEDTE